MSSQKKFSPGRRARMSGGFMVNNWGVSNSSISASPLSPECKLASKKMAMFGCLHEACLPSRLSCWLIHEVIPDWIRGPRRLAACPSCEERRGKADSVRSVTRGPSLSTCAYVQHIPACVYFRTKTLILTRSARSRLPELRTDRTALSPSTFPSEATEVRKTVPTRQCVVPRHSTINRKHLSQNRKCCSLIGPPWFSKDQWQSSYF